jgi:hypothetical protein
MRHPWQPGPECKRVNHSEIVSFLWGVADLIRDTFKRGKYQDIILLGDPADVAGPQAPSSAASTRTLSSRSRCCGGSIACLR